jgi:hypothetical protein
MKLPALFTAALAALTLTAAHASTLVDTWTYDGGGLDPATYGGNYKPATLVGDATSTGDAIITGVSAFTSGGIGSSGFPDGYGGIYTFFGSGTLTVQTSTVLADVDTITFSLLAGGGSPTPLTFTQPSLALNFNAGNTAVAASSFNAGDTVVVSSPIGNQTLTPYTWTWDVGALGGSSSFSFDIVIPEASHHSFLSDFALTQTSAVPEPAAFAAFAGLGALLLAAFRRRRAA